MFSPKVSCYTKNIVIEKERSRKGRKMVLEVRDLEKSFEETHVLRGVSFRAESGKAFGLLGRNGAGKTTTIRILMDLFPADGGQILLNGEPIRYPGLKLGYLPEERGLYPKKKIIDQLAYFAELKGLSRKDAIHEVDRWLERLDMKDARNERLDTLSKGNQQKVQLITALVHDPDIIFLDEPFAGLDPVNAMLLKDVVREQILQDKIVLFSSHQMNYIEEFCDRIGILNNGTMALEGDLEDIKRSYVRDKLLVRTEYPELLYGSFGPDCKTLENGSVLVKLPSPGEKRTVMKFLVENYDIDEVKVQEPSLNDIFVEYAGDAPKEEPV